MQDSFLTLMLQSVSGLALVLAIFAALVWMLKRLQNKRYFPNEKTTIQVIQRFPIDAKHSVIEMTHGNKAYLIGLSPSGMIKLDSSTCEPGDTPSPGSKK